MNKKFLYLLIILAVILGGWFVFANVKTYKLGGIVSSVDVDKNSVIVNGNLDLEKKIGISESFEFEVRLNSGTKIRRIAIQIPDTREMFKIDDLPQEKSEVSLNILKKDIERAKNVVSFNAKVKRNSLNPFVFRTMEIEYRLPVFEIQN